MIFFLNYKGILTRQDTGRIFQGSTAVPEIKVFSGVSSATSVLKVAFTLPNGLTTQYFPLTNIGEYDTNGVKAYLWSLELATDILANVTEQVGTVGVSVRQVNAVSGSVVASYTATFDVEYSALPVPATEYTPADTEALMTLLEAYYNQNVTLIDSIQGDYESVVARVTENEGDIATLETDVDRLEELTDKPLLVDITTDLETGIGTKTYNDGTSVTFEVGKDVTVSSRGNFMTEVLFTAESQNWAEDDGTYTLTFSPETLERTNDKCIVAVDKLDGNGYKQTANGVFKGSDGTLMLYGVATPFDGKLLVLAGSGAGTKIWSNALQQGSALTGLSFDTSTAPDIYNNFLINGGNPKLIVTETYSLQIGDETLTGYCGLLAQNIADPPQAELVWSTLKFALDENGNPVTTGEQKVVYRENRNTQYYPNNPTGWLVDSLTFDTPVVVEAVNGQDKWGDYITATTKDDLYNVAVVGDYYLDIFTSEWFLCTSKVNGGITWTYLFSGKADITLNGERVSSPDFYAPITTRATNSNNQVYVLTPQGDNAPDWERMTIETTDNLTYAFKIGGQSIGNITLTKEVFLDSVTYNPETKKLTFTYNTGSGKASVDVDLSDLEEVSNALIATNENEFNAYLTEGNIGKTISYNGGLYVIMQDGGTINAPLVNLITSITSDGAEMNFTIVNGTTINVPIEYEEVGIADVLSYNDLTDEPIIYADLDTITPVAKTYYKHTGTTSTYTNNAIYYYDGTEYKAITGSESELAKIKLIDTWVGEPTNLDTVDGICWNEVAGIYGNDSEQLHQQLIDIAHRVPIVGGNNIELYVDEELGRVKISSLVEVPTKTSELQNDSDFATNSSVNEKIADLVGTAPQALDTLGELAEALGNHEEAYDALLEVVGEKASGTHTHTITPSGSVTSSFSGATMTATGSFKPKGVVSAPIAEVTQNQSTFVKSVGLHATLNNKKLIISTSPTTANAITGVSVLVGQPTFTGTTDTISVSGTTTGSVSSTFIGTTAQSTSTPK